MKNHNDNTDAVETTKTTHAIDASLDAPDMNDTSDDSISTEKTGMSEDQLEQELEEILGGDDSINDEA